MAPLQQTSKPGLYWDATKASLAKIAETNMPLVSAGVAFFAMLSLFPALAALIAILGLVSDPNVVVAQIEEVRALLPHDVYEIVNRQVVSLVSANPDTLGWAGIVSLLAALWSARAGVGAVMIGLNAVQDERNRTTARHYARALLLTVALVGVGIVALLTVVVAPVVLSFLPLGTLGNFVAETVRWTVAVLVLLGGLSVLYRFGPNRRHRRYRLVTPGSLFAVLSWAVVSVGFSFYVANFGRYNQIYGSIGAVIAMMIWMWISAFLVLLGAALNAQIDRRTGAVPTEADP